MKRGNVGLGVVIALAWLATAAAAEPTDPSILRSGYIPPDVYLAVCVRPAELAPVAAMQPVVDAFDALLRPAKLGISVADIEEARFILVGSGGDQPDGGMLVVRTRAAFDWKQVMAGQGQLDAEEIDGRAVYRFNNNDYLWFPDDRTLVLADGRNVGIARAFEAADPADRPAWAERWEQAAKKPLAGILRMAMVARGGDAVAGQPLAVLAAEANMAILGGEWTPRGLKLLGSIDTASVEAAKRVAPAAAQGLVDFAELIVNELGQQLDQESNERLIEQLSKLLGGTQFATQGTSVEMQGLVTPEMLKVFAETARMVGEGK